MGAFAARCTLSTIILLAVCTLEAHFCQLLVPCPKGCCVLCSYGLLCQNVGCFEVTAAMSMRGTSSVLSSLLCTCVVHKFIMAAKMCDKWHILSCVVRTVLFCSWHCQLEVLNVCALSYSGSRGPVHCRTPEVLPREEGTVGAGMQAECEHRSACRWCLSAALCCPAPQGWVLALLPFQKLTVSLFTCGFRKSVANTKVKR